MHGSSSMGNLHQAAMQANHLAMAGAPLLGSWGCMETCCSSLPAVSPGRQP